jgi:hypothetical protein
VDLFLDLDGGFAVTARKRAARQLYSAERDFPWISALATAYSGRVSKALSTGQSPGFLAANRLAS